MNTKYCRQCTPLVILSDSGLYVYFSRTHPWDRRYRFSKMYVWLCVATCGWSKNDLLPHPMKNIDDFCQVMRCISGFCDIATLNWDKCCWQRLAKPWTGENELCRSCTIFNFKFSLLYFQLANWTQLSSWKFDATYILSIFSTRFTPHQSFKGPMNSEKSWKGFSSWNSSIWSHVKWPNI